MGMGSSQARLLTLITRQGNVGRQLQHLAHEKDALTREMRGVSRKYNQALQKKVLKWSNNEGVNYVDLTYSTLMRPNASNGNKPVLLTNNNGKVVLDNKYAEFARTISPDGKPVGDWENNPNRDAILSKLTGIEPGTMTQYTELLKEIPNLEDQVADCGEKAFEFVNISDFVKKMGDVYGYSYSSPGDRSAKSNVWNHIYNHCLNGPGNHDSAAAQRAGWQLKYDSLWPLGTSKTNAKNGISDILNQITTNLTPYLDSGKLETFKKACKEIQTSYEQKIDAANADCAQTSIVTKENTHCGGNYCVNIYYMIQDLLFKYVGVDDYKSGNTSFEIIPESKNGEAYRDYNKACKALEEKIEQKNQLLTSTQESQFNFYDQLFTAICENGWTADYQTSDQEYLNQMLQNNEYYITKMIENEPVCNCENNTDLTRGLSKYEYDIDVWSNQENIFAVNDEQIRQEALADYEYQKGLISSKESRIDRRMKDLETEQSSIKQMIEGINQVKNDNIETYFSIFT